MLRTRELLAKVHESSLYTLYTQLCSWPIEKVCFSNFSDSALRPIEPQLVILARLAHRLFGAPDTRQSSFCSNGKAKRERAWKLPRRKVQGGLSSNLRGKRARLFCSHDRFCRGMRFIGQSHSIRLKTRCVCREKIRKFADLGNFPFCNSIYENYLILINLIILIIALHQL